MAHIEIKDLTYRYPDGTLALDKLNLEIEQGEIFGFLGPNGSGMSTTFNIIRGLLKPDAGHALMDGCALGQDGKDADAKIGFMPEKT